jgi:hypothetical protein
MALSIYWNEVEWALPSVPAGGYCEKCHWAKSLCKCNLSSCVVAKHERPGDSGTQFRSDSSEHRKTQKKTVNSLISLEDGRRQ